MSFTFGGNTATPGASSLFGGSGATAPGLGQAQKPAGTGFSFGTPQTSTGGTPGFSGFGTPSSTTSTPAAGGFSFGGNAAKPAATAAPSGISFGTPSAAPPSNAFSLSGNPAAAGATPTLGQANPTAAGFGIGGAPGTTASTGFGFGTAIPQAAATTANTLGGLLGSTTATTAPAATTGFGLGGAKPAGTGLTLGGATGTMGLGATPAATTTTSSGGFNMAGGLGSGLGATTLSGGGLTLGGGLGTTATTSSGLMLGAGGMKLGASVAPTATTTTAASTGLTFKLPGTSTATTAGGTTSSFSTLGAGATSAIGTTTATTGMNPVKPDAMNYRQLEEQINKWTVELEEQEKVFLQQATQVNGWDRLLIDNADRITQLNNDVESVKLDQNRLDQELDFILGQQRELGDLLAPLEKAAEQLPPVNYQHHADVEREHTYQLAENIDAQLKRMVQDLKEIVEHVNTNNTGGDTSDPVQQIGRILNAHMDSLQWVDQNSALLQRRVEEVARQAETRRKEQERNFRLAYD